jgi:hypothetical protein
VSKRVSEEVRIMETLRGLDPAKREVVLNLAVAEFRAKVKAAPKKRRVPSDTLGAPQ